MEKFEELLNSLKDSLKKTITTESSADDIQKVDDLTKQADDILAEHKALVEEHKKMKDLYIKNVMSYGSADKPKDESTPRTLEEIAKEVTAKK